MKKQSILCCLLACILLPVFAQETDTSVPEAAVPAEKPQTSEISSKDEKKFGITPALMLSAWGIEPAVSVQIFRGEAEISVPVTVSMENKAGVGVTAGLGFNSNPFNEGVQHGVGLSFTHYPQSYMDATLLGSVISNTTDSTTDVASRISTLSVYYRFGYRWDLGLGVFVKFCLPLVGWYGDTTLTSFNIAGLLVNGMVGITQTSIGIRFTF